MVFADDIFAGQFLFFRPTDEVGLPLECFLGIQHFLCFGEETFPTFPFYPICDGPNLVQLVGGKFECA